MEQVIKVVLGAFLLLKKNHTGRPWQRYDSLSAFKLLFTFLINLVS